MAFSFFIGSNTSQIFCISTKQIKNVKKGYTPVCPVTLICINFQIKAIQIVKDNFVSEKSTQISPFLKKNKRNSKLSCTMGAVVFSSWLLYLQKLSSKKKICGRMM